METHAVPEAVTSVHTEAIQELAEVISPEQARTNDSAEIQRFKQWLNWKLSPFRLQVETISYMIEEEDWVFFIISADEIVNHVNTESLRESFRVGVVVAKKRIEKGKAVIKNPQDPNSPL